MEKRRLQLSIPVVCGMLIFLLGTPCHAQDGIGRYEIKNLKVKSYYKNQQGELIRWTDDELLKIDTVTGTVWRWVSERDNNKKELKEYWKEVTDGETPMLDGSR